MKHFRFYTRSVIPFSTYLGFLGFFVATVLYACQLQNPNEQQTQGLPDIPFIQEFHDGYQISSVAADNQVRRITIDTASNIWIATASGIFQKKYGSKKWESIITGEGRGPAFDVLAKKDGSVMMATWNGVYSFSNNQLKKETGPKAPVSVLCSSKNETYALGPYGIWQFTADGWKFMNYKIARSVRCAATDGKGSIWVGTDAGLYLCKDGQATLFQDTGQLISCYVKAIAFANSGACWVGTLGGVSIRKQEQLYKKLTPKNGLSSSYVNCIESGPDSIMWVGTHTGVVRFDTHNNPSLLFSRRWLVNDQVNDICFDKQGNAWLATEGGVSCIRRQRMTLAEKEKNFYSQLMYRHIRDPWACSSVHLEVAGDTSTWKPEDDDNDGEYTGGYLAMESFRYAVTRSQDAHQKARKAFEFLKQLQTITGTKGFFARSMVPHNWKNVHDPNRIYTEKEIADELVKDPRYKRVEQRWRPSADGKWKWKGDTSSDEMDGHFMAYFYFYEYAANAEEKEMVRAHVKKIMDELIANNYNLVDIDGSHTHWAVWSPKQLNGDPDWSSERSLNSMELLAYLKFTFGITGDSVYQKEYERLIDKEGYLENAKGINAKNPAWQIYFDRTMEGYIFPMLLRYEKDQKIRAVYEEMLEKWIKAQDSGENLINNLAYTLCTGKKINVQQTIDFLRQTPLDLVEWIIDHRQREDVRLVRAPILEDLQIDQLPPPAIRATVRWDKNPWSAVQGNPNSMREPVFWLWPYWEARFLGIIK